MTDNRAKLDPNDPAYSEQIAERHREHLLKVRMESAEEKRKQCKPAADCIANKFRASLRREQYKRNFIIAAVVMYFFMGLHNLVLRSEVNHVKAVIRSMERREAFELERKYGR